MIRTAGDPLQLVPAIRRQLEAIDKGLPLYDVQPLTAIVSSALNQPRHLGMLAALLTGIFGLVAFDIAQRTRLVVIALASCIPAVRATTMDPVEALRYE